MRYERAAIVQAGHFQLIEEDLKEVLEPGTPTVTPTTTTRDAHHEPSASKLISRCSFSLIGSPMFLHSGEPSDHSTSLPQELPTQKGNLSGRRRHLDLGLHHLGLLCGRCQLMFLQKCSCLAWHRLFNPFKLGALSRLSRQGFICMTGRSL